MGVEDRGLSDRGGDAGHVRPVPRRGRPRIGRSPSDLLILCYHALSDDWPAVLSTTPERFREQLEFLVGRGYRGVTFTEAVTGASNGRRVAVTFDDAYRSVLALARPILDELGLTATVFAPTAYPDGEGPMAWPGTDRWLGGPHERELACMSWAELRGLAAHGWEIGSHTHTHPHLTRLDDERLAHELSESRAICTERLGAACESLAYPYGDVDDRVAAATARAGYRTAATLQAWIPHPSALRWPRVGIYNGDVRWRWRLKLSPALRRTASWPPVNRALTALR